MPDDHVEAIGDTLPELYVIILLNLCGDTHQNLRSLLLGYGQKDNAYYIRCHDCCEYYSKHPEEWAEWEQEFQVTQERLERLERKLAQ
jgi:SWI/SNF-related matrix-associated actin-dependent regulator of chromatin subfamily A member 5